MRHQYVLICLVLLVACAPEPTHGPATETASPLRANINVRVQDDTPIVLPPVPRPNSLPFDGIPPIYEPEFASASSAALIDDELILGVSIGDEARAYPVTVLRFREMVNDEIAGVPLLVTW